MSSVGVKSSILGLKRGFKTQQLPGRAVASLQGWESNPQITLAPSLQHPHPFCDSRLSMDVPGDVKKPKKTRVFCTVVHAASSSSVRAVSLSLFLSVLALGFKFPVGFAEQKDFGVLECM